MPTPTNNIIPQPWTHGPGHLFPWVGAGGGGLTPAYLGTAEVTPRIEIRNANEPYFNSIFSTRVPMDWSDQGEEAFVYADVNRWAEAVYEATMTRPNPFGTMGIRFGGEQGALSIFEGFAYPLTIQFPFQISHPAFASGLPGIRFLNCKLVGPDTWEPIGTTPSKRRLIWHCLPSVTIGPNNSIISQLYDFNLGSPLVIA